MHQRALVVMLRGGDRLDCRLVSSDRFNWVFETNSELATPATWLVPKHAVDRIEIGRRMGEP